MNDFRADLHCHSLFSDGTDSPQALIQKAIDIGLSGLAITDHDTIAAYGEALAVAAEHQFPLLNGVEFSASYRSEPVHILGYSFDLKSQEIASLCLRHQARREERNLRILANLQRLGIPIELSELGHQGSWGRPHIASVLVQKGIVSSIQEAFDIYLGEGKAAFDPGEQVSVEETIQVIQAGNGKAILAHPHLLKRSTTIRALLKMPFDGLECYYAKFTLGQEQKWINLAKERGLLITGGSDYHGSIKPHSALGTSWVPKETFEFLYSLFKKNNL